MKQNEIVNTPRIVVIGGGSGQPIILKGLKQYDVDLTAVITVADDGGSSGTLRDYLNIIPPGDVRNVMAVMSDVSDELIDIFQYRFKKEDEMLAGHALGNLIIAAMAEKENDIFRGVQILSRLMNVEGHIYPVANEPLVLHAQFKDGTELSGEAEITAAHKVIDHIWVTPQENSRMKEAQAPSEVINAILNADEIVLGPGSLYTSVLPNLVVPNVKEALKLTPAKITYVANIMTQKGETDNYTESDHVHAINQHMGENIVDAVIMNSAPVPEDYIDWQRWNEVSHQVQSDPEDVRKEGAVPITGNLLQLRDDGAFHDGDMVASLIMQIAEDKTKRDNSIQ
ncbi:putative cofD-like protein [Weissella uvarum]|uniref:gluconeogenesis factor YvcK family protein n=1 Tax=Weissella uvarum TaxID=1479233 RepID=UPI001960C84D|nr:uridine diphosphate-N-acetylglucosamine-binding protein YvcK [Weissella uvarum]MBM7616682.1 putative cofD-like protein [Weissella uvarum]MCM0594863.1 YvcK family protein [Weissella uvarum]